jgi:hypothetical protein
MCQIISSDPLLVVFLHGVLLIRLSRWAPRPKPEIRQAVPEVV